MELYGKEKKGKIIRKIIFIVIIFSLVFGGVCLYQNIQKTPTLQENNMDSIVNMEVEDQFVETFVTDDEAEYNISLKTDNVLNSTESTISIDRIIDAREYNNDLAFILFESDGKDYKGFLDRKGNLKFYIPVEAFAPDEEIYAYDVDFDNGYSWFQYNDIFYVIDSTGDVKSQYDNGNVVCYGGGYTWIVNNVNKSWDNAGTHEFILYNPNGKEVSNFSIDNVYYESGDYYFGLVYVGEGVFAYNILDVSEGTESPEDKCILYYTDTSKAIETEVEFLKVRDAGIHNGIIVLTGTENEYQWQGDDNPFVITLIKNGKIQEVKITGEIIGEVGSYPSLLGWSGQYILFTIVQNDHSIFWVYDIENKKVKTYNGKYTDYVTDYTGADSNVYQNILAIRMRGADKKGYVCLVNADTMADIGDPIKAHSFENLYLENGILAVDTGTEKVVYDLSNKALAYLESDQAIKNIGDDVLVITEEDQNGKEKNFRYLHFDGTEIFQEVNISGSKAVIESVED